MDPSVYSNWSDHSVLLAIRITTFLCPDQMGPWDPCCVPFSRLWNFLVVILSENGFPRWAGTKLPWFFLVTPLNNPPDSISSGVVNVQSISYGLSKDPAPSPACNVSWWMLLVFLFFQLPFSLSQLLCSSLQRLCPEGIHISAPVAEVLNSREQVAAGSLSPPCEYHSTLAAYTWFHVKHQNLLGSFPVWHCWLNELMHGRHLEPYLAIGGNYSKRVY